MGMADYPSFFVRKKIWNTMLIKNGSDGRKHARQISMYMADVLFTNRNVIRLTISIIMYNSLIMSILVFVFFVYYLVYINLSLLCNKYT